MEKSGRLAHTHHEKSMLPKKNQQKKKKNGSRYPKGKERALGESEMKAMRKE